MIPKVIHYCWFGGASLPELTLKCIESWKRYCPDYKIVCWNETNYFVNEKCAYVKEAYEQRKWAFVSDYARLDVIYNYGGIYLDTDVELISSLDEFLSEKCFLGMETSGFIATGLGFGAKKKSLAVKKMLDEYNGIHFMIDKNIFDTMPCPKRNTKPFIQEGFKENFLEVQHLKTATVYPPEYFCPIDYATKELYITKNTKSIHHYGAMWVSETEKRIESLVKNYAKTHGKIATLIYKNILEYRFAKKEKHMSLYAFISKKVKIKYLKIQGKLN